MSLLVVISSEKFLVKSKHVIVVLFVRQSYADMVI